MAPARITDFFRQRLVDSNQALTARPPPPPPARAPPAPGPAAAPAKRQTFLDVGQRGLGHRTCPACGMCYDPAFSADAAKHQRFHEARLLGGPPRFAPKGADCIALPGAGSLLVLAHGPETAGLVQQITALMDAAPVLGLAYTVYAVVGADHDVRAFALVEAIQAAHGASPQAAPQPCRLAAARTPARIGIARIWVAPLHRKAGLATLLLEGVRRTYARPLVVGRRALAFSQPTADGFALAAAYQRGLFPDCSCLVYL